MNTAPIRVIYATNPPERTAPVRPSGRRSRRPHTPREPWNRARVLRLSSLIAVIVIAVAVTISALMRPSVGDSAPTLPAAVTISVFLLAVWAWTSTTLDDTLVAFLAAVALIVTGVLPSQTFFASLGDETIWLLICAFIIATGVSSSGLALRGAAQLLRLARSPRALFHLTTLALTITTFAVPATSGRAALAIPVFTALAASLAGGVALTRALSLLFPTVILLSAVGSLLGAGAHVITAQLVESATGHGFGFLSWLWFGLPLAIVSSHVACEIVLLRFTASADRRVGIRITLADLARTAPTPVSGPLSPLERRAAVLLAGVVVMWCTESLHHVPPAVVALLGAVVAVSPSIGCTSLPVAVKKVPWTLLLFLAATLALASALTATGAAAWLGRLALAPMASLGPAAGIAFALVVIALSLLAHLMIPSRSARSAAIIPLVIVLAPGLGVDPAAAAFASTAAAGFCHTLPSSAKPVAMFADPDVVSDGFRSGDLRSLSVILGPAMFLLVAGFSFWIWPAMGMPLLI
ncbi:SLC13 family permease [Microbacterium murale]|uniref:Sodium-dependent dicarboxylate transporter 2/3/5 n=1 Tax=Microbacterium murale TaxID=1081040 RepID=A0ABU0P5A3_9MICO|nr:SLC13 family permease [Microbacterium murale]MDQ0642503.1 sodium-dependent dicarboxylate transporter 2/3/5 [Microbacterium murale]